jgi:hypothetical protein
LTDQPNTKLPRENFQPERSDSDSAIGDACTACCQIANNIKGHDRNFCFLVGLNTPAEAKMNKLFGLVMSPVDHVDQLSH